VGREQCPFVGGWSTEAAQYKQRLDPSQQAAVMFPSYKRSWVGGEVLQVDQVKAIHGNIPWPRPGWACRDGDKYTIVSKRVCIILHLGGCGLTCSP
jgi:hypothetical protein